MAEKFITEGPMTTTATQLMTAEEFYDFCHRPENRERSFELDRGRVVEMSRPGERHGCTCANVSRILGNYTFQERQGYVCGNDTGVIWERDPDSVKGPDVIYYSETRQFRDLNPKYSEEPPRLAVEVLSPTDRPNKVNRRISEFLKLRVAQVWLLDPEDMTLAIHRPNALPEILEAHQELTVEDLLPGFRCKVVTFFLLPGEADPTLPPSLS
jgi:Uma2 family endonuclease